MSALATTWVIFSKELRDALRDRRTLLAVALSSLLLGPLLLVLLSALVATLEERAQSREVVIAGIDHGPTLANFLQRQGLLLRPAPADFEQALVERRLGDAVLVIPPGFDADLAAGLRPTLLLVGATGNTRASGTQGRLRQLLQAFNQEQATLRLALRGVAPVLLEAIRVDERDLAEPRARSAQLTAMLPCLVLMAVLYGALAAALDSTAGERERGSLEPLLSNPAPRGAIVVGKWAAVACVSMLVATLSSLSFLPGQWLLRSQSLAALFQYGPREAGLFIALLLPLAGLLSALLMALAIRCRSVKQAQANAALLLLLVSLAPLLSLLNVEAEQPWQLAVPALAQVTLMGRVLRGEALPAMDLLLPLGVTLLLTLLCLVDLARQLRSATAN